MEQESPRGERLKTARLAAGLTQEEVAERFGIEASTVCRWEGKNADPGTDRLAQLAALYSADVKWLAFGGEPVAPASSPAEAPQ